MRRLSLVYFTQNGPNEFTIIGTWKGWDITARLPEISVPTLVTVEKYDEIIPKIAKRFILEYVIRH